MDIKAHFSEKLSEILFVEIKQEALNKIFGVYEKSDIYMPIRPFRIVDKAKEGNALDQIPVSYFIEGIFYVLGADNKFKYNEVYLKIIESRKESLVIVKKIIGEEISEKKYEEAYILLKGLTFVERVQDNYTKLLALCDFLRKSNGDMYKEELLEIIEEAKSINTFSDPYYYEAAIFNEEEDFKRAENSLNEYKLRDGKLTDEVIELKDYVELNLKYEKGKELIEDNPAEALKILLPLVEQIGDNVMIYYHIAVAYRNLKNYEKAIYYINEALSLDSSVVEIVNELGINYACLGDFKNAVSCFRKAFEVTKSIEICTNIIMCYLNLNDIEQAKLHIEIAKKIDSNDEVLKSLEKNLSNM